jgi:hypothetical protein
MISVTSTAVTSLQNENPGFTNKGRRPLSLYIHSGEHATHREVDF